MFVRLTDGRYVETPLFYGSDWFLDCREEPTLYVHTYRAPSEEGLRKRMRKILRESGVVATLSSEVSYRGVSPFPPNFNGLKASASIRVTLLLPVPARLACHAQVFASERPLGQEILNER